MNNLNYEKLSISIAFSDGWIGLYKLTQWEHKHFHPSGDPKPSKDDIEVTKRIDEGCRLMGLDFVDHIIVGDKDRFYSFKGHELLSDSRLNLRAVGEIVRDIKENEQDTVKRKNR
ncbi:MAG TPA: hypothetical protein DCE48_17205 [Lachnospiraceae bacterium]|uniref:JAB domain-containing protein n=1 Tax=Anaerosporobacter sp. TaxID=1872529 RepID=UPI000EC63D84|nr:JAB domain-containing protein [Anaerosporobacter sp.]HAB62403.1 hypothetical protein [Lachnospiraceae bacterium]